MTAIQMIPLNKLVASPDNVRTIRAASDIKALAENIEAVGLLQNLTVKKAQGGNFEVVAGEGRRQAMNLLVKDKRCTADFPTPCRVMEDDEDAHEVSLSENELRTAMHPADQFDAFKVLADAGEGNDTIAAKFGITPRVVQQRLKMQSVSPKLMKAFREGEMKLEHVMALTLTDDHKLQEKAWKGLTAYSREDTEHGADMIRRELTDELIDAADDAMAKFVTVKAYEEAGGKVTRDLFDDESKGYLSDKALLEKLALERLEKLAARKREEGWKWVEVQISDREPKGLGKLKQDWNGDAKFTKAEMAKSGVIVAIGYNGQVKYMRGLIRAEDLREIKKEAKDKKGAKTEIAEAPTTRDPLALSASLLTALTTARTMVLQARLAANPKVALAALAHRLALDVFYSGYPQSVIDIHPTDQMLFDAENNTTGLAAKEMEALRIAVMKGLPKDEDKLWGWLLDQDQKRIIQILTYCTAQTVDAVAGSVVAGTDYSNAAADQLAEALKLDMADYWEPTGESYLNSASKELITLAVQEGCGKPEALKIVDLKKGDAAKAAEKALKGKRWLPAILRGGK